MRKTNDKTQPVIFCLFHQKVGCDCINPVTDKEQLEYRITQHLSLLRLHLKFGINNPVETQRSIDQLETRLKTL